jgi:hypothetical protein
MTEPSPTRTPTIALANWLVAISLVAPFTLYLLFIPTYLVRRYSNPYASLDPVLMAVVGFAIAFGIVGVWIYSGFRERPAAWQPGGCFYGSLLAFYCLPLTFELKDDLRIKDADVAYATVAVAVNAGIVLLGWLPARRAAQMVLGNLLSPEVVNSPYTVAFKARGKDIVRLRVTPEKLTVEARPNSGDNTTKADYPLTDVKAVTVRTETRDGEYPVPGAKGKKPIDVPRGDVVVIDLPDGELIFPVKDDGHRIKRFVEARCQAVVAGG